MTQLMGFAVSVPKLQSPRYVLEYLGLSLSVEKVGISVVLPAAKRLLLESRAAWFCRTAKVGSGGRRLVNPRALRSLVGKFTAAAVCVPGALSYTAVLWNIMRGPGFRWSPRRANNLAALSTRGWEAITWLSQALTRPVHDVCGNTASRAPRWKPLECCIVASVFAAVDYSGEGGMGGHWSKVWPHTEQVPIETIPLGGKYSTGGEVLAILRVVELVWGALGDRDRYDASTAALALEVATDLQAAMKAIARGQSTACSRLNSMLVDLAEVVANACVLLQVHWVDRSRN
jgi:hypothetical protein